MQSSAQVLEGNKVKLTVEIDEEELKQAEDETLRRLTREARVPGFRPGKVPRRLLEARLGPKAIRAEVLRDALPRYYADAVEASELDVIASPEIDITAGEEGGPLTFDAVVEVRPQVSVAGYDGLVVTVTRPEASDEEVDAQVDRLREQFATLRAVERPARPGDLVTLDIHGTRDGEPAEGLSADDLVYEVGTGGIVAGVDDRLVGAKVGDVLELDAEDVPGGPAHLRILVKQVREKVLPVADDAFAAEASEFDTLAELRRDLAERIVSVRRAAAALELRERAIEALVALVDEEPPASLVDAQAEQLLDDLSHRLARQKVPFEAYLAARGETVDGLMAELREQAARQVKADLALRAVAAAEGIEVDEGELDEEIVRLAQQARQTPAQVRRALEQGGRLEGLRSQLKIAKAARWVVDHVAIVDDEGRPMDRAELGIEEAAGEDQPGAAVTVRAGSSGSGEE
jgi:trigger factor